MARILVGMRKSDFQDDNNRIVEGYSFYLLDPDPPAGTIGQACERVWVKKSIVPDSFVIDPSSYIGQKVRVYYDRGRRSPSEVVFDL